MISYLSPKRVSEIEFLGVDFSARLQEGETIVACLITPSLVSGSNSSGSMFPSPGMSAPEVIGGTVVRQLWMGGTAGSMYQLAVQAQTSLGQFLMEYIHIRVIA